MNDRKYVLPGEARASVVIGLQSYTSQKWRLLRAVRLGGPFARRGRIRRRGGVWHTLWYKRGSPYVRQ